MRSSCQSVNMLSHSLLVNTGNILSLSEARQKASQNSTDEVSWQLRYVTLYFFRGGCTSVVIARRRSIYYSWGWGYVASPCRDCLSHPFDPFQLTETLKIILNDEQSRGNDTTVVRISVFRRFSVSAMRECFSERLIDFLSITVVDQWKEGHESAGCG